MEIGVAIRRGYRRKDRHGKKKKMKKEKNRKGDEYDFNRRFAINVDFQLLFPRISDSFSR